MFEVFLDLTLWSWKNRLRVGLRRLRQPRYLVGAMVAMLWLGFTVFGPRHHRAPASASGRQISTPIEWLVQHADVARFGVALALLAIALAIACWPGRRRALQFTPAEVQFLFQAPIERRQLLHYKLLRSQGGLLFGSLVATVMLRPASFRDGWMFYVGFWLALTVSRLFATGVSLGAERPRHRRLLRAVSLGAIAVLGVAAAPVYGRLATATGLLDGLQTLRPVWSAGAARVVLWPFVTLATLPLAGSAAAFWSALPGVLLLVVASYVWVLRTDSAFEEAAAANAGKPAAPPVLQPRLRRPGKPVPFPLALEGPPETAILWKNLILLGRYVSLSTLLRLLPVAIVVPLFAVRWGGRNGTVAATVIALAATALFYAVVVGPGIVRNDLRRDLRRLAVLKTWPVSGVAIVRGELLAPAIVLSLAAWLLIAVVALVLAGARSGRIAAVVLPHLGGYAVGASLVAPAIILAQLVVQNGIAVLLPAWMLSGRSQPGGLDRLGQIMLVVWGGFVATAVVLAPAALAGRLIMVVIAAFTGTSGIVIAAAVLLALVLGECLLLTGWLGRVLERSDLSAIDPVE